jgi:septation ring formation regulator EzrA
MGGVQRDGPSDATAAPAAAADAGPCGRLKQAYDQLERQTALDIAAIQHLLDGLFPDIAKKGTEKTEGHNQIVAIERDIKTEGGRRKSWSKYERRFSDLASGYEKVVLDCDRQMKSAGAKTAQLQKALDNAASAKDTARIQQQIAENNAKRDKLTAGQTKSRSSRDDADQMSKVCAAQVTKSDEYVASLKAMEQKATANLAAANYQFKELMGHVAHQRDLLKQAKKRLERAHKAWIECKSKELAAAASS